MTISPVTLTGDADERFTPFGTCFRLDEDVTVLFQSVTFQCVTNEQRGVRPRRLGEVLNNGAQTRVTFDQ